MEIARSREIMACYEHHGKFLNCTIPTMSTCDEVTYYMVNVRIGEFVWSVKHRYRDFSELHGKLVSCHGIPKDLLPPKKLIRNRESSFIEKRRASLENYLQTICQFLQKMLPRDVAEFLHLQYYEVLFLSRQMALHLSTEGEVLLTKKMFVTFSPLQLHAVSERCQLALSPMDSGDASQDFSHVLDFCSQLRFLCVYGNNTRVGTSNIIPNLLPYELSAFKNLHTLEVRSANLSNISGLENARRSVVMLKVHGCRANNVSEILLCDTVHHDSGLQWSCVTTANFSANDLSDVDLNIQLMPLVQNINLSQNKLTSIAQHFAGLPHLQTLDLSDNCIHTLDSLHMKLGNIVTLNLSQNKLSSLEGMSRLFSLVTLDVSCNCIEVLETVHSLSRLPCLENLLLTGNPVASSIDYRVKVLQQFGNRVSEICLDNERPTQKEMDTVAVLQALQAAREAKNMNH